MAEAGEGVTLIISAASWPGKVELCCMNCEEGRKTEMAQRASHSIRMERPGEQFRTRELMEEGTEEGGHVGA